MASGKKPARSEKRAGRQRLEMLVRDVEGVRPGRHRLVVEQQRSCEATSRAETGSQSRRK